jgi:hypothetical protein
MFKFGRIVSLDYPHETLAEFGKDGVRCIIPIRFKKPDGTYINLIVCGCEKRTLEVYELVETQQTLTCRLVDHHDLNCQPRALAYNPKKKLLSLTSFGILFEVYALTYEGDGPKLTLVFREGLHLEDLVWTKFTSKKTLLVTSYGIGFAEFLVPNSPEKAFYNVQGETDLGWIPRPETPLLMKRAAKLKCRGTKVSCAAKVGAGKFLMLDWDRKRYFQWDQKRQCVSWLKTRPLSSIGSKLLTA